MKPRSLRHYMAIAPLTRIPTADESETMINEATALALKKLSREERRAISTAARRISEGNGPKRIRGLGKKGALELFSYLDLIANGGGK